MSSDLLKRLAFLTRISGLILASLFGYNLITFIDGRQYIQLIVFAIINISLVLAPIKKEFYSYNKWDVTLVLANIYSILILYNNLTGFFGLSFTVICVTIALTMGTITIRARYYSNHVYSPMEEDLKYTISDEGDEKHKVIPLEGDDE